MKKLIVGLAAISILCTQCSTTDDGLQNHNTLAEYSADLAASGAYSGYNSGSQGDTYHALEENGFIDVLEEPLSTFSIDADGGSYSNVRRFIQQDKQLPPSGAVRIEEMINYFDLDYAYNDYTHPIALNGEIADCPWNPEHKLLRIGIQGQDIPRVPPTNFVFLLDVSGSMGSPDKLDLLVSGFKRFVSTLGADDRIAIVTYAGSAGVVLESTPGDQHAVINSALDNLISGGSTAGAAGIEDAYAIAEAHYIEGGNNRIILGTDGDFNVGISDKDELIELIEEKRESGVFLTVLGVGRGNLNDAALEQIANNGNGTYEYIDKDEQLDKVFIHERSKFYTVAKDVKVQVTFNKNVITSYRLIGYENRLLSNEDFEDDTKDAGEIGAGQNITAFYEIVPSGLPEARIYPAINLSFRYKNPEAGSSNLMHLEVYDDETRFEEASEAMKFTTVVSAFGMQLIDSEYKGDLDYTQLLELMQLLDFEDDYGYKEEFKSLVLEATSL